MAYNYGFTKCVDCGRETPKTGPRTNRCPECALKHKRQVRNTWHMQRRIKDGDPAVGVGRGGSNKKGSEHPQYKNGIGRFNALKKLMYAEIKQCERCGKDLTNVQSDEKCVHHIDHDRTHNVRENLIVLCKRCHQLEHKCWKAFEGATTSSCERSGQETAKQVASLKDEDIV